MDERNRIKRSLDRIEPNEDAKERMLRNVYLKAESDTNEARKATLSPKKTALRILIAAACFATVIAAIVVIPNLTRRTTDPQAAVVGTSLSTDEPEPAPPGEDNTGRAIGGSGPFCTVHAISYHSWSPEMIELVGEEAFLEWNRNCEYILFTDDCHYPEASVYGFIKYFDIPREDLEYVYLNTVTYYSQVLNLDLLYSGNDEAVDAFYRNTEELKKTEERRSAFAWLKSYCRYHDLDRWVEQFGTDRITPQISFKSIVDAFGLTRQEVENLILSVDNPPYRYSDDPEYFYSYNTEALFDGSMDGLSPFEQDALFCGIEDYMSE